MTKRKERNPGKGRVRRRGGFTGTPNQRAFKRLIVAILRRSRAG